jgi:LIVCS family branched-chain amino acid:cation transporter
MKESKQPSSFVIGLALFAMFFGSGNLIFPLYIGQLAQGEWSAATIGFILTAVLVPFLGIISMVVYKGDYGRFFSCLGKKGGFLAIFLLLSVWIPLGSGPRCISLAYASFKAHLDNPPPLWLFSFLYCVAVSVVIFKKKRMLDVLGYFLTPLLLGCLALIVFKGVDFTHLHAASSFTAEQMFTRGLKEGYNTMDLIAAFFFSASVIEILRSTAASESKALLKAFRASIVGIATLGIVYLGLITLAASHTDTLSSVPKDQMLVHIAKTVLGQELGIIAAAAISLACFTTSVALGSVFADFLTQKIFRNQERYFVSIIITHLLAFSMSIFGLQGITFVTEPILQVFYPSLIVLIVFNLGRIWLKGNQAVEPEAVQADTVQLAVSDS